MQLARDARLHAGRVAVLLAVATWLPPLVLAAIEGVAWGGAVQVPFVRDFLPYGQLLIAIPVLVLGELMVARHLMRAVAELRTSEVLDSKDTPILDAVLAKTVRRWRGRSVNAVLLILTCAATVVSLLGADEWLTGGWQIAGDGMTLAGWWYLLISLPVMLRYGYKHELAAGVICASGTLGQIVPPSVVLIVLADQLGVSVGDLFVGSLIPGLSLIHI